MYWCVSAGDKRLIIAEEFPVGVRRQFQIERAIVSRCSLPNVKFGSAGLANAIQRSVKKTAGSRIVAEIIIADGHDAVGRHGDGGVESLLVAGGKILRRLVHFDRCAPVEAAVGRLGKSDVVVLPLKRLSCQTM